MLVNAFGAIALDATVALVKASVDLVKTAVDELKTAVTDGTLRGTVMVSGPVDTGLAPLTNVQLRAAAVAVDTGLTPLTDGELRATPIAVSGTVAVMEPVTVDGTVLVANPTADPETGLAKDATFAKDADGGIKTHVQNFPATQPISGTVDVASLPEVEVKNDSGNPLSITGTVDSRFKRLLKFEPSSGEELRADDLSTDRYHGAAPDGTATATASWDVVRFYKDASGNITRVRFRSGVAWDSHTAGWS